MAPFLCGGYVSSRSSQQALHAAGILAPECMSPDDSLWIHWYHQAEGR
jgi:hypothetical protein